MIHIPVIPSMETMPAPQNPTTQAGNPARSPGLFFLMMQTMCGAAEDAAADFLDPEECLQEGQIPGAEPPEQRREPDPAAASSFAVGIPLLWTEAAPPPLPPEEPAKAAAIDGPDSGSPPRLCPQPPGTQGPPVVSILEGNQSDQDMNPEAGPAHLPGPADTEQNTAQGGAKPSAAYAPPAPPGEMARTPQSETRTTERTEAPAPEQNIQPEPISNPCPLENENDSRENEDGPRPSGAEDRQKSKPDRTVAGEGFPVGQSIDLSPQRVSAQGRLETARGEPPVSQSELFDALVARIEQADRNEMELQLKPAFLGKVAIRLSLSEGALHVKIQAGDAGVRRMMHSRIELLAETLSEKGIKVAEIQVTDPGVSGQSFRESPSNRQPQQQKDPRSPGRTGGKSPLTAADPRSIWSETVPDMPDGAESSVEYRA